MKAINCLSGYQQLIDFCDAYKIPYKLCGKIIVAKNQKDLENLDKIRVSGIAKGLKNLNYIDAKGIKEIEPNIEGVRAITVPQAGIIDYKVVCQQIKKILIEKGCSFFFDRQVLEINLQSSSVEIKTSNGKFESNKLVNCTGLYSDKLAKLSGEKINFQIIPFRGEYYKLSSHLNHLVNGLVYPVPNPDFPFLGVHLTKKLDNSIEAGPNAVLAFRREGYHLKNFHLGELWETIRYRGFQKLVAKYTSIGLNEIYRSMSKKKFLSDLQEFVPSLKLSDIQYKGAGVRAQVCNEDGSLMDDFLILSNERIVNVCNAPSPAATSCLSIGATIAGKVLG